MWLGWNLIKVWKIMSRMCHRIAITVKALRNTCKVITCHTSRQNMNKRKTVKKIWASKNRTENDLKWRRRPKNIYIKLKFHFLNGKKYKYEKKMKKKNYRKNKITILSSKKKIYCRVEHSHVLIWRIEFPFTHNNNVQYTHTHRQVFICHSYFSKSSQQQTLFEWL